jgi:hypothetical protein
METKLNSNIFLLKNKIVKLKIQEKLMARIEVEDVSYLNEQEIPNYAKDPSLKRWKNEILEEMMRVSERAAE